MEMKWRYPDDPTRITRDYLCELNESQPGTWLAQVKYDDWRRPAYRIGKDWNFGSKYGGAKAEIQPPPDLVRELDSMGWPENIALDMGWMGRRCKDVLRGKNMLVVFDMLYLNGAWQGGVPFRQRYDNLKTIFEVARAKAKGPTDRIVLADLQDGDLVKLFDAQKQDPLSEGLVLRRFDSLLIGNFRNREKNPLWKKIKYRDIHEPTGY